MLYERDIHLYWHAAGRGLRARGRRRVVAGVGPDPRLRPAAARQLQRAGPVPAHLAQPPAPALVVLHAVRGRASRAVRGRGLPAPGGGWSAAASGALVGAMCGRRAGPFISLTILWHHFAGAAWLPWTVAAHALAAARNARGRAGAPGRGPGPRNSSRGRSRCRRWGP